MPNLLRSLTSDEKRSDMSFTDYLDLVQMSYGGHTYLLPQTYGSPNREDIPSDFAGYVEGVYKRNGVVFACMAARQLVFSEARFQYQRFNQGRPGDLFGDRSLALLETPWPNGTTGELLSRMDQDVSLAGNFYCTVRVRNGRPNVVRMRPDRVTIVTGSMDEPYGTDTSDLDAELVGYFYDPQHRPGQVTSDKAVFLPPEEVCHYSPVPDPMARYRGMSWLTPVVREIAGDNAATTHKLKFFENGATVNLVVTLDKSVSTENFTRFVEMMDEGHKGHLNAYKTLYLGGGADAKAVGSDFRQMDFKRVQGAGETRICAAAQVPPIIVGVSEGLDASTYSNYGQAKRKFGDMWARPAWRSAAAALARLVQVPEGARLWYDDRDIAFLKDDQKDQAEILNANANAIRQLTEAGYTATSVIQAVTTGDLKLLEHTGLFSVQLQEPGATQPGSPAREEPVPKARTLRFHRDENGMTTEVEEVIADAG